MASFPKSSTLSKVNAFISLIGVILYAVGALVSQWLTAKFVVPMMPPVVPADITVDAHMGLLESCSESKVAGNVISEGCSSDGAADWQKIAAGTACVGAAGAVAGLVLALLNITVAKVAGKRALKLSLAACCFAATGFMTTSLILYGLNKKIQVRPPLPLKVDFDLDWAFAISAVSAGIHAILVLLVLVDSCRDPENSVFDFQWSKQTEEAKMQHANSPTK